MLIKQGTRYKEIATTAKDLTDVPSPVLLKANTEVATLKYRNYFAKINVASNIEIDWSPDGNEDNITHYSDASEFSKDLVDLITINHTTKNYTFIPWEHDKRVKNVTGAARFVLTIGLSIDSDIIIVLKRGVDIAGQTRSMVDNILRTAFDSYLDSNTKNVRTLNNFDFTANAIRQYSDERLFEMYLYLNNYREHFYGKEDKDKVLPKVEKYMKLVEKEYIERKQ